MKKKDSKKTVKAPKLTKMKPKWENVYHEDYREYFVSQAQLSRSVRGDGVVHLTFYDESIAPLQGKLKKPVVERVIKTTLVIPDKALGRIAAFLNNVVNENSGSKSSVEEKIVKEKVESSEAETSYIR